MSDYQKYLKYKEKYLLAKQQMGGMKIWKQGDDLLAMALGFESHTQYKEYLKQQEELPYECYLGPCTKAKATEEKNEYHRPITKRNLSEDKKRKEQAAKDYIEETRKTMYPNYGTDNWNNKSWWKTETKVKIMNEILEGYEKLIRKVDEEYGENSVRYNKIKQDQMDYAEYSGADKFKSLDNMKTWYKKYYELVYQDLVKKAQAK